MERDQLPGGFIIDGEEPRNLAQPLHKAAPGQKLCPRKAPPTPSCPSTSIQGVAAPWSLPWMAAVYYPPNLRYPSCYRDEGEGGDRAFLLPQRQWAASPKCGPRPAASVALGNLFTMRILRSHPRRTKSETPGGWQAGALHKPCRWSVPTDTQAKQVVGDPPPASLGGM